MPDSTPPAGLAAPSPGVIPSAPPPTSPGTGPRPSPRTVLIIAVVAVVVIGALFVGGFGKGSSGGSSSSAAASTFSSARSVADQFAAAHGQWTLIEGVGVALANASYLPYNGTGNASCPVTTLVGTEPTNLTLPAFHGSLTSGEAPIWLFAYVVPGVGGELAIVEVGDQIALAVELPASCSTGLSEFRGITTPIVDSSTAVAAAAAAGGTDFLQAHPVGVSLTMDVFGGLVLSNESVSAPDWLVSWSTCSNTLFSGSPTSGDEFSAVVNATTGSMVPGGATNTTCGPGTAPPPQSGGIASAISLGDARLTVGSGTGGTIASQGCNSGDYCYVVPITMTSQNLTPADFELYVQNYSNGTPLVSTEGFAIANENGTVLVYSLGDLETQWTPAAGTAETLLAAGMSIEVDLGTALPASELGLELTGEGPFANSGLDITL